MPKCSCLGKNPDCYKCGGWGWIGDQIYESRKPEKIGFRSTTNKKRGQMEPRDKDCPFCNKKCANLHHHVSVSHIDCWVKYTRESDALGWLENSGLVRCPLCGALVSKFDRHLQKGHSIEKRSINLNLYSHPKLNS